MRIILSESKPIHELRKVYNDKVTFVTTVKTYPLVHEIELPGDYNGAMKKRRVPARVGRKLDKEIEAYETQLTKIWDTYQKRIQRVTSFEDVKLIRRLLANDTSVKKAGLTLARVLQETDPSRRQILQIRFIKQEKQRLVKSQLDEMRKRMERISRPAFERVYKIGKIRSQILSDQELDDDLTPQDRKVLEEKDKWNSDFLNRLSDDSWAHYEALFARRFDDPNDIIDALIDTQKKEKRERSRLPLFAAAVGSVLLAAGIARAAKDIFTDPKTGKEQDEPILDDAGVPIGDPIKGGTWHTRHDNNVCPGCEDNDRKWMTTDDFDKEAGTNQCLTRCRCIELFELRERPLRESEIWRGTPGASIRNWPRFKKHLMGEHDQQSHDPKTGRGATATMTEPKTSGFVTAFVEPGGEYVEVFKNPSSKRDLAEVTSMPGSGVRAFLKDNGDLFYWDAVKAIHFEAQKNIDPKREMVPIEIYDGYVRITDSVRGRFGGENVELEDRVKAASKIIRTHKDKLHRLIGEFEVGHYNQDVIGNVALQSYSRFDDNDKVVKLRKFYKNLDKHLMGEHDQQTHGRRGGAAPAPVNFPNPRALRAAKAYVRQAGLPDVTSHMPVKVDKARARRIADAYDQMKHDPSSLEVRAAYKSMADEVLEQYKTLPVKIKYTKGDPYPDSKSMMRDVLKNRRLRIFTGGEPHPLLGAKGLDGVTINDNFRAVHDYYGHAMRGFKFGPSGEENAWMEHSKMFSPTAQLAMTTETRGQNSWFNFSKENEGKEPKDKKFARQKVGILPDEFLPKRARRRTVQIQ